MPSVPFPRIPLAEAKEIVAERGYEVPRADDDMDPEGERQIAAYVNEEFGHEFVFLTDYASSIRPFYHRRHEDDPGLTNSYDLIFNGVEISTGAQREHRIDVLDRAGARQGPQPRGDRRSTSTSSATACRRTADSAWGSSRVIMLLLHQPSIREVTYLFRGPEPPGAVAPAPTRW